MGRAIQTLLLRVIAALPSLALAQAAFDEDLAKQAGSRWWAIGPDTAPDWGLRLNVTLLFPK